MTQPAPASSVLTTETLVRIRPGILTAEMDGETVLLDAESGAYSALGSTGSRIAALIAEPVSLGDLCRQLTGIYAVDPETCLADVTPFLSGLIGDGLVEIAG
ncbi:PqqD family protein (plasmid) [Tistrella mobilis]|uniref:PqqD family protein n=1 Tax=Tistrella mobilis TaxID=171437 RepID=UPI003556824D